MPNNKNKHSGGVSCSACNAIFLIHSYVVTNPYMAYKPENLDTLKKQCCNYPEISMRFNQRVMYPNADSIDPD